MTAIYLDKKLDDDSRRKLIYGGDVFVYSANEHSMALVEVARKLIADAFPGIDPRTAQYRYDVREFASVLAKLKPAFIHHPDCKKIIPRMLESIGCDLDQTHFDIPRMRSSTSNNYLTTGIAYAFHPHRDTWYSAPMCQINWWLPIFEIEAGNAMAFHPNYFSRSVMNDSDTYNYQEWNTKLRFNAVEQIGADTRPQPKPQEKIALDPEIVVVAPPGGMMLFSAESKTEKGKLELIHIEGDADNPVNRGTLCPKGAGALDFIRSEQRVKHPMYRKPGSNKFERVDWNFALDRIAKLMKEDRDANFVELNKDGTPVNRWPTMGFLSGCATTNETGWVTYKLTRGLGIVQLENQARI